MAVRRTLVSDTAGTLDTLDTHKTVRRLLFQVLAPTNITTDKLNENGLKKVLRTIKQPEGETTSWRLEEGSQVWNLLVRVGLAAALRSKGGECH